MITAGAESIQRHKTGKVILECAKCGAQVSWPVTVNPRRRAAMADTAPASGVLVLGTGRDFGEVAIVALASARVDTQPSVKQARNCENGHFVARVRSEPHPPPHVVEFPLERVSVRRINKT